MPNVSLTLRKLPHVVLGLIYIIGLPTFVAAALSRSHKKAHRNFQIQRQTLSVPRGGSESGGGEIDNGGEDENSIFHSGSSIPNSSIEQKESNAHQPESKLSLDEPMVNEIQPQWRSNLHQSSKAQRNPSLHSSHHQHQYQRQNKHQHIMTRSDERAILGRAVLTTPHRRMPAIRIAPGPRPPFTSPQNPGPIMTATPIYVTKFSLCQSLGCKLRDLRVIDQFFPSSSSSSSSTSSGDYSANSYTRYSGPAFLARNNCVIVNVGHVRAIVMRNQVLIFVPEVATTSSGSSMGGSSGSVTGTAARSTSSSSNQDSKDSSSVDVMGTIECLVEALVTHLNSIYHSSHHLIFDEEDDGHGTHMKLLPKDNTLMGQQWGSGWYHHQGTSVSSGIIPSSPSQNGTDGNRKTRWGRRESKVNRRSVPVTSAGTGPSGIPTASAPPFELVVVEALLGHVCSFKSSQVAGITEMTESVLEGITHNFNEKGTRERTETATAVTGHKRFGEKVKAGHKSKKKDAFIGMQEKLGELLPLKNRVDVLEAKCAEVASAIAEVLKNDEDMAAMRLTEIHDRRHDNHGSQDALLEGDPNNLHVEVELLFEDYLLQMDELLLSLRSLQNSVRNTEEVVEIELDLLRNRIMRYEMLLELSGLVVGVAAAVTGAFGMNLINHFEEHPSMFYNVSGVLVLFMGALGYAILRKLSNDHIL